jgi:hypothetical protein
VKLVLLLRDVEKLVGVTDPSQLAGRCCRMEAKINRARRMLKKADVDAWDAHARAEVAGLGAQVAAARRRFEALGAEVRSQAAQMGYVEDDMDKMITNVALGADHAARHAVTDRRLFRARVRAAYERIDAPRRSVLGPLGVVRAVYADLVAEGRRGRGGFAGAVHESVVTLSLVWQHVEVGDFIERFMQALVDTTGDPATVPASTLDALLQLTDRVKWPAPEADGGQGDGPA